jgi:hypothetical protein
MREFFVRSTTLPSVDERRKTTSLLCQSMAVHSNASCSPALAPV